MRNKVLIEEFEIIEGHICVTYQYKHTPSTAHIVKELFDKWLIENSKLEVVEDSVVAGSKEHFEYKLSLEEYYSNAEYNEFTINGDLRDYIYENVIV